MKKKHLLTICCVSVIQACGYSYDRKEALPANPGYFSVRELIIKPHCTTCHPAFESHKVLMELVSPGNAAGSPLFYEIDSDNMPPTGKKVADEKKTMLKAWIDQGAKL